LPVGSDAQWVATARALGLDALADDRRWPPTLGGSPSVRG
jgi:hypothetical protein